MKTPTTLIILDGFGLDAPSQCNAIRNANTPNLDQIFKENPGCQLAACGLDVGLPEGQMGNSEVGHTNIGAGRVVFQDLPRISQAIDDGSLFENTAYLDVMAHCKQKGKALHIMGLLSDGGVHSHISHLFALLRLAKSQGLQEVYIHAFLDGRDVAPTSGVSFVRQCLDACKEIGIGQIATLMGRYFAMDRDQRWERVQLAYNAIVCGEAPLALDPVAAVEASYANGITDEFLDPVICTEGAQVQQEDGIIFFNFRPDRARELTRTLVDPDFTYIIRPRGFFPVHFVCTTSYDAAMPNVSVAFPSEELHNTFGEYISRSGLSQLRIAETEKYAHVTFFFNGGREEAFPLEDRVMIPSPKVPTYDLKPEMSAYQVAAEAVKRIESGKYDVIILNFANCDMVGHTGIYDAAVKAVEAVDACTAQVVAATSSMGGMSLITADHGNAECMWDALGDPITSHTTNAVPFFIVGAEVQLRNGKLADIAPTILDLIGLEKPDEMNGSTLITN